MTKYAEVRQTEPGLEAWGIGQGSAVPLLVGRDVDYRPGDVTLARRRCSSGVGRLAVLLDFTAGGAVFALPGAGGPKRVEIPAHAFEFRGRAFRTDAELAAKRPAFISGAALVAASRRALDMD